MTHVSLLGRYAVTGVATLLTYIGVGSALKWGGVGGLVALSVPFAAAVLLNYVMQRNWVFRETRPPSESIPKYVAMILVGFAINAAALELLTGRFHFLLVQLSAVCLVVASNAMLAFLWVFSQPARAAKT